MARFDGERLPQDAIDRAAVLLRRSLPGTRTSLPSCLPSEAIELLLDARNARAEMYSNMEDLTDRCRTLAEEADDIGVVVHIMDDDDADSLVHHIELAEGSLDGDAVSMEADAFAAVAAGQRRR